MSEPSRDRVDVGVLFVHGIGNQPEGSTLKEGGGLARTLGGWARPVTEPDWKQVPGDPKSRLVEIGSGTDSRTALAAEGWWAGEVPAPGAGTLLWWLLSVVPLVVPRVLDAGLRRSSMRMDDADWWRPLFFGSGVVRLAQNAFVVAATLSLLAALVALWALALPRAALDRIRSAGPRAGDAPVLVPVLCGTALGAAVLLVIPGTSAKQGAVAVLAMLILVTGWTLPRLLNTTLAAFVGDCYALLRQEPIERAMVQRVESCLAWLEGEVKGAPIVIVAHSQGAELVRRVIAERENGVRGLVTYGAGIAKLDAVDRLRASPWTAIAALALRIVSAAIAVVAVVVVVRTWLALDALAIAIALLAVALVPLSGARKLLQKVVGESYTSDRFGFGPKKVGRWLDLQTANDPVSEGALPIDASWGEAREIVNARVLLLDHVLYWRNVEGFCAPLILELATVVGLGHPAEVGNAVRAAAADRTRRVGHRVLLRVAFVAVAVAAFVVASGIARFIIAGALLLAAAGVEWLLVSRAGARARRWSPCSDAQG